MMSDEEDIMETPGWHWRISLSIIMGVGWLVFLILWLFFYAESFSVYQNIAIFIASLLIIGGVLGAAWAPWGMRHSRKYSCTSCGSKIFKNEFCPKCGEKQ